MKLREIIAITESGSSAAGTEFVVTNPSTDEFSFTASNCVTTPQRIERVRITTDLVVERFVESGWQSWSTVRPTTPGDARPERSDAPRWFRHQMLADGAAAGLALSADTMLLHEGGVLGSLDLAGPPVTFRIEADGSVFIDVLLDGIILEPGATRDLASIATLEGDPSALYSGWAETSGVRAGRRPSRPAPLGWCSWYQYFTEVTANDIRTNTALAAQHGLELIQIDDGWQASIGEWGSTNERFGTPIEGLAAEIQDAGMSAGIWTAPFLAIEGGPLATNRPEWLVTNEAGTPRTAMVHGLWGGRVFALDTSRLDVQDHLIATYRNLRNLGFTYFKIDFLHAGAVPGSRATSGTATRFDALRQGLEAIRTGIGDDAYLLGCGCPLGAGVGIVDAMRVSEDVAPHWEPGAHFAGWPESSVGTMNAVEQSIRRSPLHRRWFSNDPDCALLRPVETTLTSQQRRVLAETVTGTGGFTMVSDDLSTYSPVEWDILAAMDQQRTLVDTPLELIDPLSKTSLSVAGENHYLSVDLVTPTSSLSVVPSKDR